MSQQRKRAKEMMEERSKQQSQRKEDKKYLTLMGRKCKSHNKIGQ